MKTLLYISIALIMIANTYDKYKCNIYVIRVPIVKSQCKKDQAIQEIEAQIKYQSIILFFDSEYKVDLLYYNLLQSQQEQMINEFKSNTLKLKDLFNKFGNLQLDSYIGKLKDNVNPHDNKVEQAYKNFQQINQFLQLFKQSLRFLEFELIQTKQYDLCGDFIYKQFPIKKIQQLKQNYYICTGQDFEDLFQFNQNFNQNFDCGHRYHKIDLLQISCGEDIDLKIFQNQIKMEDCPNKISSLQSFNLEFQKLRELSKFKSNYISESKQAFQQLFEQVDQLILNSLPIREKLQSIQIKQEFKFKYDRLKQLLEDKKVQNIFQNQINDLPNGWQEIIEEIKIRDQPFHGLSMSRLHIYQQINEYIELINDSTQFFNLDKQYFEELHQSVDSLSSYIEDFQYQTDYIERGIKYFQRDEEICKSEIQKQNLAKECESKMENIEQKIYQYQQANELNRFVSNDTHYEILFGTMTSLNKQISESIKKMEEYQQRFMISDKLYFVQVYPSHLHPEDLVSVKVYENLIKLQNLIVFLQNAFTKADEFLDYKDQLIISYQDQYSSLKKSINDKVYLQNYSWTKVEEQLHQLYKDYEKCSNRKYNQINQDYGNLENYYWFEKQFSPRNPYNLIILPNVIEQFDKDDISDYSKMSEQCAAEIEGIVEDIFETLMIIELLKYKEQGQNQFDLMILQAMSFQEDFLLQARKLFFDIKLPEKMRYFNFISKQSIDQELQDKFDKLHNFNDQLDYFFYNYQNSMDLLKYNRKIFNDMKRIQGIVNNYLTKQKYQLSDKQQELLQLYGEYKACTGQEFLFDFCQSYEEQNIYGGICQQSCFYEPKKLNAIQVDVKIQQKHNNNKKLHQQKSKQAKKIKNKQNHNKFK